MAAANCENMQVTVDLFSGVPNPSWELSVAEGEVFLDLLRSLPVKPDAVRMNEGLGYNGLIVTGIEPYLKNCREVVIFNECVLIHQQNQTQQLSDQARNLEQWLFQTGKGRLEPILYQLIQTQVN